MTDSERLEELLINMPKSYEDAVHGTLVVARKENCTKELIAFIENNPKATPSDLQHYINEEIWKIPDTDAYKEYLSKKATDVEDFT